MRLVFATHNRNKVRELEALLKDALPARSPRSPISVLTLSDLGIADDVVEDGATFADNAGIKARAAHDRTGLYALADDSGLVVDALSGAPGVHSARYGGEPRSDPRNLEVLLDAIRHVPEGRRTARFHCTLCLYGGPGTQVLRSAECEGTLIFSPRGENGFGYDPIFVPTPAELGERRDLSGLTLAEIPSADKNRLSHRAKAMRALVPVLIQLALENTRRLA